MSIFRKLNPRSVISASGEDALDFIQGQLTQDVSGMETGAARYGFLLTQKGRVVGDVVVIYESEENLKLVSWSLTSEVLMHRLESYIIADDVELADETGQWNGWQVAGGEAVSWLQQQLRGSGGGGFVGWNEVNTLSEGSIRILAAMEPAWPAAWQRADDRLFEGLRIAAGIPLVPDDLGAGDFPQEAGQEKVGVSFTKGCYLGQEVMARLATTGRVRRQLRRVKGTGNPPSEPKSALAQNGKTVGELRSTVESDTGNWIGLAMINLAHYIPTDHLISSAGETIEVLETS